VRGVLSAKNGWTSSRDTDKVYGFKSTVNYILKFLKKDYGAIDIDEDAIEKRAFAKHIKSINQNKKPGSILNVSRGQLRKSLIYPAQYYVDRKYSPEILDRYDVGLCLSPGKPMSGRVVNPYCCVCDCYHMLNNHCGKEKGRFYQKWKHNEGFTAENYLYNLWFARKYIEELGYAILVESPGNVWRLEEAGIHNAVAIFGTTLNDSQLSLLNMTGAMKLVLLMDNDAPGLKARDSIIQKCSKLYNIISPDYSGTDIGEMSVEQINTEIKPILEKLK
jgi:5S rRNA maturation endonuclease (ribonuclease M5)